MDFSSALCAQLFFALKWQQIWGFARFLLLNVSSFDLKQNTAWMNYIEIEVYKKWPNIVWEGGKSSFLQKIFWEFKPRPFFYFLDSWAFLLYSERSYKDSFFPDFMFIRIFLKRTVY